MSLTGKLAEPLSEHLLDRRLTVVELTEGALLTGDEPVVTVHDSDGVPSACP